MLVVATGGRPAPANEYLYGQHPAVITQRELEERLAAGHVRQGQPAQRGHDPVRRLARAGAALLQPGVLHPGGQERAELKQVGLKTDVYVLYREVRTYGFREAYYQAARDEGVVFMRYELPESRK